MNTRARFAACTLAALLLAEPAGAHERWVQHILKHPLQDAFFRRWPGHPLSLQPSMMRIGVNAFAALLLFLLLWFARDFLTEWIRTHLFAGVGERLRRAFDQIAAFLTDRPVDNRVFRVAGEWAVIAFLRTPGLVLMYSATNDSLVMPSYPLDPASAVFFKFTQAALAILILTQTALPLCGAMLLGTWLYLFRWGWMVSIDALPVLAVAAVYLTSPWVSHKLAITTMTPAQTRAVRIILGVAFMALGWMKIYNYNLVAGVADNYPAVMNDPMIKLLTFGTSASYARESWVVAFGMAEVLSGFLLASGVFVRVWGVAMIFIFTKLMLVDFGWDEIPHIFPIAALLALLFSNELQGALEALQQRAARPRYAAINVARAIAVAAVVVFPLLWLLTFFDRSKL